MPVSHLLLKIFFYPPLKSFSVVVHAMHACIQERVFGALELEYPHGTFFFLHEAPNCGTLENRKQEKTDKKKREWRQWSERRLFGLYNWHATTDGQNRTRIWRDRHSRNRTRRAMLWCATSQKKQQVDGQASEWSRAMHVCPRQNQPKQSRLLLALCLAWSLIRSSTH